MAANDRTGAGAIDVNVAGDDLRFGALDVGRAAREKPGGQREFGAVRDLECFIKIARPDDAEHRTKNLFARYPRLRTDAREDRWRNEKGFLLSMCSSESGA